MAVDNAHLDFELYVFNSEIDASLALVEQEVVTLADVSANAVLEFDMSQVFKFSSDAQDVDGLSGEDLKYWVNNFPVFNPMHASLHTSYAHSDHASGSVGDVGFSGTAYSNQKMTIADDFLRHIASELFNGAYDFADNFSNEAQVANDLFEKGVGISNNVIGPAVAAAGTSSLPLEHDESTDTADNLTRRLLEQLLSSETGRTRLSAALAAAQAANTNNVAIPLEDGDTISFTIKVNPAANQGASWTAGTTVSSRLYRVLLVQRDVPASITTVDPRPLATASAIGTQAQN